MKSDNRVSEKAEPAFRRLSSAWRLFSAISLPPDVQSRLMEHSRRLREVVPHTSASWSRSEGIHLTVKFFGDVEQNEVEKISVAAARVVERFSPFRIMVEGTGVFPSQRNPRVLWIGLTDPSGNLKKLQQDFDQECESAGFPKEPRPFHPHLTVARLRKPDGARALAEAHTAMNFKSVEIAVSELLLIRSELSSTGSKYSVISRHQLSDK